MEKTENNLKEDSEKKFNPSYEVIEETYGTNPYSTDCCRCNPQRC